MCVSPVLAWPLPRSLCWDMFHVLYSDREMAVNETGWTGWGQAAVERDRVKDVVACSSRKFHKACG